MYSKVLSSDAKIESVTCTEARKLILEREDDLIGHRRLVYTIDKADKTKLLIRQLTVDFFKIHLGFTDNDIIFVDRNEFNLDETNGISEFKKFSAETT